TVHIVTKKKDFDSNTNYAQGGIASVFDPHDSIELHIQDTLISGAGLCNEQAVRILAESGPKRVQELMDWGAHFSTQTNQNGSVTLDLGREGGHSHNRIVHAKDLTGQEVERALLDAIAKIKNITIFENHTAVDLLTQHQLKLAGRHTNNSVSDITCYGAYILDNTSGVVHIFNAAYTLLATGGIGQIYLHTTNPDIATGDGIAMAYRAGALIADMEFIQFHPTAFYQPGNKERSFLISEAVRGEGGILVNSRGERFMDTVHPLKELAPRDIVARTIDMELKRLGDTCVFLDISFKDKDFLISRFPTIYRYCLESGVDMTKEPIPVVPAAHYLCGGIVSDLNGKTSIENCYVSGESACTGIHGANRLASNSLLEGIVFSHRAYCHIQETFNPELKATIPEFPQWDKKGTFDLEEWILIQHNVEDVKRIMWDYVGIMRSNLRLERAERRIALLEDEIQDYYKRSTVTSRLIELRNLVTTAKLVVESALLRKESRGLHYNINYPQQDEKLKGSFIISCNQPPMFMKISDISFS
ncbi:MAG TPA: L-aspartate oxidase, partial [Spirochaetota bacterium]|nr:L-aspartate oxidase [Spirochaetota bacterium]